MERRQILMNNKILVLGANGMLGGSLFRYFSCDKQFQVLGTTRSHTSGQALKNQGFDNVVINVDANNIKSIEQEIEKFKPNYVLNCIGIIKQLPAASNYIQSLKINALLPHELAKICTAHQSKLIHFSTDCVFTGGRGSYLEDDFPDAYDLYGRSKLLGEVTYDGHITLRTSIIGHEIGSQNSLVDWFLAQKTNVNGFSKAFFSGLPTCYVAEVIAKYVMPTKSLSGLYHLSASRISKFELLNIINTVYDKNIEINDSVELVIDRSLDCKKFIAKTNYKPECWDSLVRKMNYEYVKYFTK